MRSSYLVTTHWQYSPTSCYFLQNLLLNCPFSNSLNSRSSHTQLLNLELCNFNVNFFLIKMELHVSLPLLVTSFISSNLIHNSYINYIKLNASTCFRRHPPILRRSTSFITIHDTDQKTTLTS